MISALDCVSPVTGVERKRNWSEVPWMAAPEAVTVRVPLVVDSEPAMAGLRMSWQVTGPAVVSPGSSVVGQLASAGGVVVELLRPKA